MTQQVDNAPCRDSRLLRPGEERSLNNERQIAALAGLDLDDLRRRWITSRLGARPKIQSAEILRRIMADRMQSEVYGGLPKSSRRKLRRLAAAFERNPDYRPSPSYDVKPGTLLTREWRGVRHEVRVLGDVFEYRGRRFTSLSKIACEIAGTRWSGPAFFGLMKAQKSQ